jgi:hypothetical protein
VNVLLLLSCSTPTTDPMRPIGDRWSGATRSCDDAARVLCYTAVGGDGSQSISCLSGEPYDRVCAPRTREAGS